MNEAKEANLNLRVESRQLLKQREKRFAAMLNTDRAERQRDLDDFAKR